MLVEESSKEAQMLEELKPIGIKYKGKACKVLFNKN